MMGWGTPGSLGKLSTALHFEQLTSHLEQQRKNHSKGKTTQNHVKQLPKQRKQKLFGCGGLVWAWRTGSQTSRPAPQSHLSTTASRVSCCMLPQQEQEPCRQKAHFMHSACATDQHPQVLGRFSLKGHIFQPGAIVYLCNIQGLLNIT